MKNIIFLLFLSLIPSISFYVSFFLPKERSKGGVRKRERGEIERKRKRETDRQTDRDRENMENMWRSHLKNLWNYINLTVGTQFALISSLFLSLLFGLGFAILTFDPKMAQSILFHFLDGNTEGSV